ncbi:MAG: hypothetical protein CMJ58_18960 [Planctomycetaceae bacterium]|nr:hypothetical protein [Planctomycetaceae bacterium]
MHFRVKSTRSWPAILAITSAVFVATPLAARDAAPRAAEFGIDATRLEVIEQMVAAAIEEKKLPGCVVTIGRTGGVAFCRAYGDRQLVPSREPMTTDTVFDMASLTKPLATATSVMQLVERGQVRLRAPVADYLPEFAAGGKESLTVEQLLIHHTGLVPDNPLDDYQHGVEEAWRRIYALKPIEPPGTKFIYSDVNFEVLGALIERVSGEPLADYVRHNIYEPLGMNETGYLPNEQLRQRAAPSEQRDGRWLRGEVHDPRAALLDGVAGHAGLFSTPADLARYCDAMLRTLHSDQAPPAPLSHAAAVEMIQPRDVSGAKRALGWDSASRYSSNRGDLLSKAAFGHGGFTGTALWIDPQLDLFVIFLSNRLHPDGSGSVNDLAGRISAVAAAAIVGENHRKTEPVDVSLASTRASSEGGAARDVSDVSPSVLTGIDVLQRDGFAALKGMRVGLITNHTGLNRDGQSTIDLLHAAPDVELVAIFSPEHGIAGKLDQSEIADTRHEGTGVVVYSLYGESRRPSPEQLAELDAVVFDIQDIGARFYTYISTMGEAMSAAADAGLKFVVLDRPNPLGGIEVAGPMRDADDESFVAYHVLPVQHGMTTGELAKMFVAQRDLKLDLQVIAAENWRRGQAWDATGLTWVNPSPNMRSLTQAFLYPGIGLLETTNLSVGRGTDTPFELFGAPWIDGRQLAAELNAAGIAGVRFVPIRFTPQSSKFAGQQCQGVNVIVVDRAALQPVPMGLQIACTLRRLYGDAWEIKRYARLLTNAEVLQAIADGKSPAEIESLYKPALEQFKQRRGEFLIYRE